MTSHDPSTTFVQSSLRGGGQGDSFGRPCVMEGQKKRKTIPKNLIRTNFYSVMQSDGNSFCGDVILDSFNKAYWKEEFFKNKYIKANIFGFFKDQLT